MKLGILAVGLLLSALCGAGAADAGRAAFVSPGLLRPCPRAASVRGWSTPKMAAGSGSGGQAGRRDLVKGLAGLGLGLLAPALARGMEWVPDAPKEGDCADCIGVKDGFLANCPDSPTCVSSQDDQGPKADWANAYAEPWVYEGKFENAMLKLKFEVQRMGGQIVKEEGRYLRALFREQNLPGQVDHFDDAEFYFTENDSTVQFRSARRMNKVSSSILGDLGANKKRMEQLRKKLRWEKLIVLRNRKRAFLFFESPLDTFGPACNGVACGEDLEGASVRDGIMQPQRFDNDPFAAPAMPIKLQKDGSK